MEDPILIYYVYNRLIRKQTRTDTQVYFKRTEEKHKNMTEQQIIEWIKKNPELAAPMMETKLKHHVGTNPFWTSKYYRLKSAIE